MTQESPLTYLLIREKWGEKKKIFQRASPHYNVNNTLLTTVLQERLARGQGTFRKPRKQTKLSQSQYKDIQMPKQATLSSLDPGMSGWKRSQNGKGRGRTERHCKGRWAPHHQDSFLSWIHQESF